MHGYTAAGAVCALAAVHAAVGQRLREAFAWLALQMAIDATDGYLARRARVADTMPHVDGGRLDDIVDYLSYVFVPAVIVQQVLLSGPASWVVASAMLIASGIGFARTDAKTADHFFTGFPSYWNIVVLYLVAFGSGPLVSTLILLTLVTLVFVPISYVYPSRTPVLRGLTIALGSVWSVLMLVVIATLPDAPAAVLAGSLVFPLYYVVLSLVLDRRRRVRRDSRA